MDELLAREYAGNSLLRWSAAAAILVIGTLVLETVKAVVQRRLSSVARQTSTRIDDFAAELVGRTRHLFLIGVALVGAAAILQLPPKAAAALRAVALVIGLLQLGVWGAWVVNELVGRRFALGSTGAPDPSRATIAGMLGLASRIVLWAVLLLVALDNFGVNITALVAGLGVGGIAVALATQNILSDLFASVSILVDKPFIVGDFVVVGDFLGTVERIGLKTTRVRSLTGEEIVFSNADLLQSRLRNFKSLRERRVVFKLGIVYETPPETLAAIPATLREIVQAQGDTRFDRAHFATYGDFALVFEIVYFVLTADYNRFMDIQQTINLEIHRRFAAERISFAYPTQTLHLERTPRGAG